MQNNEQEALLVCEQQKNSLFLDVAAKHISKATAITSVHWHAIYMALPGEIYFVVTTLKMNNCKRNLDHSSTESNCIITGRELQRSQQRGYSLWTIYIILFVVLFFLIISDLCCNLRSYKIFKGMFPSLLEIFIVYLEPQRGEGCAHSILKLRR